MIFFLIGRHFKILKSCEQLILRLSSILTAEDTIMGNIILSLILLNISELLENIL